MSSERYQSSAEPIGTTRRAAQWRAVAVMLVATSLLCSGQSASAADPVAAAAQGDLWSLRPVQNPPPPQVKDAAWPAGDVDRFILAALDEKGLKPNLPADKRTLIRRATFDLTGLPPTPEDVQAFLADSSPQAFEKVVDRLLASRQYGEKWGRHWLDVVRYADTAGDGADYPVRDAYRYRNWVIHAFNRDLPYDQFLRDQIAGDLLAAQGPPELARDRVIATGYLAQSKRFGYNVTSTQFRHLDLADTIEVLGRSVLGLSVGCARCHDHKYDPVSITDYYALYGIFDSSQYSFPGGEEHKKPEYLVSLGDPAELQRLEAERQAQIAAVDAQLKAATEEKTAAYAQVGGVGIGGPDLALELQATGGPPSMPWFTAGPNVVLAEAQSPYTNVYPVGTRGVRVGNGQPGDGIRQPVDPVRTVQNAKVLHFNIDFRNVDAVAGGGSYRFHLGQGAIVSTAVEWCATSDTFVIRHGDRFEEIRKLQTGTWYNLRLSLNLETKTYSGAIGSPGDVTEFKDKAFHPAWNGNIDAFFIDGTGHVPGPKPAHDVDNVAFRTDTPFDAPAAANPTVAAATQPPVAAADGLEALRQKLPALDQKIAELQKQRDEIAKRVLGETAYAVVEGPKPANARVQLRGEPDKLGDEVPRRFLQVLGGDEVPAGYQGSGRLQLAEWLTRPSNPLTARVMVNRVWQWHFGRGIVNTPSDFGTRGEPPTHPQLLDYLAARFVADGWSVKKMHRLLMLSRVYQMSGDDQPAATELDPQARLLWKYPRRRLQAEEVRDAMLTVAGTLDPSPGGEHPFPPVEQWTFTIHAPFYAVYDTNRRSVYLMVQRQKRHPFLSLFDGADPNISAEGRSETTTPKQALYLMNDPFVHEQSAALAKRVLAMNLPDDAQRVRAAWELTQAAEPEAGDLEQAAEFLRAYHERLASLGKPPEEQQLGAWSAYARVLLTSNGFLYVD